MGQDNRRSLTIDTGDATKKLKELQQAVKATAAAFEEAKASGNKDEKATAKKAFEEAKRALMAYQGDLRATAIAAGELGKLSFSELLKAQKDLEFSMRSLDRSSEEYRGKMEQLQTVKTAIAEVRHEMAQVRETTDKGSAAIAAMEKQGKGLADLPLESLQRLEKELTAEIARSTQGSKEFIEANRALADVRGQISAVKDEMKALGESSPSVMSQVMSGVHDFTQSLFNFPKSIGEAVARGLNSVKQFATESIEAFKSFEDKSKNLTALTGLKGDDIAYLEQRARDLAATATDTADEVLDAFTLMGSAKPELLKDKEALAETTEAALTLAAAAKMDAKSSVESLAATMNQFGAPAAEANRYINALAAGSQAGSAAVTDISKSIVKFGATASAANLSVEQSVGLIETLADKGIKGEVAGTALNSALLKLQVGVDQFNPKIVGMEQALDNLAAANLSTADMVGIFGRGNVVAGQILIENRKRFQELTSAVTGTSTAFEQAATNSDTLAVRQKVAENTINNVKIVLGQKLMPIVAVFYENVAKFWAMLEPLGDWLAPFLGAVKRGFEGLVGVIKSVGGAMVWVYEKAEPVFTFLGGVWDAFTTPMAMAIDGLKSFSHWLGTVGDVTRDYSKELAKAESHLDMLSSVAKRSAEGSKERAAAIAEINKQYGQYLPQLLTEKSSLEEIENAQRLANEALRYNIALKSQEERLSAIQKDATDRELEARERLNEILKESAGSLAGQARAELEAILDDPAGDAKLAAYKEKWKIGDGGWFSKGLGDYVAQIRSFRADAEKETTTVREAFEGMLRKKPQEYEHGGTSEKEMVGTTDLAHSAQESNAEPPPRHAHSGGVAQSAADEWRARELAELKKLRADDVIDEDQYRERLSEIQMTFLSQKHAQAVAAGEDTIALEGQIAEEMQKITEQQLKAEEERRKEAYEVRKAEVEAEFAEQRLAIQEQQLEGELSEEDAKSRLAEINVAYLEAQRQLEEEAGRSTLATQEKITTARLAIKKREQDELQKLEAEERRRAELIEKEREERNKRDAESFRQKANILKDMGVNMGQTVAQFATDAAMTEEAFGRKMALLALDSLQVVVRQAIASIWAQNMATADSIASFGVSGALKAAAMTAVVEGMFAVAKSYITAKQHYRGTLGGAPHDATIAVRGAEDGRLYQAEYMGTPEGVSYVARPALIAERGGEIVVDARRSANIRMRYPWLLDQLRAVPQHATGTLGEGVTPRDTLSAENDERTPARRYDEITARLEPLLDNLSATLSELRGQLGEPLRAYLDREELFYTLDRREAITRTQ